MNPSLNPTLFPVLRLNLNSTSRRRHCCCAWKQTVTCSSAVLPSVRWWEELKYAFSALHFKMDHTALIKNEKIIPIILLKIDVTVCDRFLFLIFKIFRDISSTSVSKIIFPFYDPFTNMAHSISHTSVSNLLNIYQIVSSYFASWHLSDRQSHSTSDEPSINKHAEWNCSHSSLWRSVCLKVIRQICFTQQIRKLINRL